MTRTLLPALLAVFALACGGKDKTDTTTPDNNTANPCANANPCATPNPCANGGAPDPALVAQGAKIVEDSCSLCHGDSGEGNKKSPAIRGPNALSKFPDDKSLFDYTKKEMPKDDPGSLSDEQVKAVVAWMRSN